MPLTKAMIEALRPGCQCLMCRAALAFMERERMRMELASMISDRREHPRQPPQCRCDECVVRDAGLSWPSEVPPLQVAVVDREPPARSTWEPPADSITDALNASPLHDCDCEKCQARPVGDRFARMDERDELMYAISRQEQRFPDRDPPTCYVCEKRAEWARDRVPLCEACWGRMCS